MVVDVGDSTPPVACAVVRLATDGSLYVHMPVGRL